MEEKKSNQQMLAAEEEAFSSAARIKYYDIVIDKGRGAIITDVEGHDYIDLLASASSTNTGHAHPKVVKAIADQAARLIQYTPAYFANSQAARLAPRRHRAPIHRFLHRGLSRLHVRLDDDLKHHLKHEP